MGAQLSLKLRCHWLKFLRNVAKALVIQGPVALLPLWPNQSLVSPETPWTLQIMTLLRFNMLASVKSSSHDEKPQVFVGNLWITYVVIHWIFYDYYNLILYNPPVLLNSTSCDIYKRFYICVILLWFYSQILVFIVVNTSICFKGYVRALKKS